MCGESSTAEATGLGLNLSCLSRRAGVRQSWLPTSASYARRAGHQDKGTCAHGFHISRLVLTACIQLAKLSLLYYAGCSTRPLHRGSHNIGLLSRVEAGLAHTAADEKVEPAREPAVPSPAAARAVPGPPLSSSTSSSRSREPGKGWEMLPFVCSACSSQHNGPHYSSELFLRCAGSGPLSLEHGETSKMLLLCTTCLVFGPALRILHCKAGTVLTCYCQWLAQMCCKCGICRALRRALPAAATASGRSALLGTTAVAGTPVKTGERGA